jgi:hypothetical protein
MSRKITNQHRLWLLNVQNSIDLKVSFDYVDITPRRIDILFDMDLVEYGKFPQGTYVLSEKGVGELSKYVLFRERKRKMLNSGQNVKRAWQQKPNKEQNPHKQNKK